MSPWVCFCCFLIITCSCDCTCEVKGQVLRSKMTKSHILSPSWSSSLRHGSVQTESVRKQMETDFRNRPARNRLKPRVQPSTSQCSKTINNTATGHRRTQMKITKVDGICFLYMCRLSLPTEAGSCADLNH